VVIAPDDKQSVPDTFSDEDVKAWYQAHQADYQSPEQVVISYLELNADNVKDIPEPTDQDLRDRFEQQKGRFVAPEKRLVSHILIAVPADADEVTRTTAKQKAEDLAKRARDGEDFAELAEQNSDDFGSKIKGGDLGWIGPGDMVKPFEDAAYKLTMEHPVSDPVQTSFGWHVILLRDIKPAEGLSFEEARPTLVQEYQEEAGEREYLDKADRMVDIVYEDPTTLEPAAAELKLQIKTAGPFSRAGGEGIAANPDVVKAAFSDLVLLQGSVSDPIELGTNHMIMLRDKEHMPAAVKPLEEVRDQVVAALRKDRAHQEALKQANALLTALQSGDTDLKTLAQDAGLEMQTVEGALRTDTSPDAPTVTGVFKLARPQENQPVYAIVEAGNGPAVVALDEVVDGSEDDVSKPELKQDRRQIANASASYDAWGLLKELRDSAEITVYEENLNSAQ